MATFQMKEMPPAEQVEELLRRGLDFYALNNADDAVRCWEQAAKIDPSDPRPAEYLAALRGDAGGSAPATPEEVIEPERLERRSLTGLREVVDELGTPDSAPRSFDRAQFIELLRGKQYEEALEALYKMHQAVPDNASVSRGIQVVKEKLLAEYLERIGNLDMVVAPSGAPGVRPSSDEVEVMRLTDGIASLGDVLSSSRLGRFATARTLCGLIDRGALVVGAAPRRSLPADVVAPPVVAPPSPVAVVVDAAAPSAEHRYDEVFRRATEAYLRRDVDTALALFAQCLEQRPDDRRVQHNIERLQQRKRKS